MSLTYGFALRPKDSSADFSGAFHSLSGDGITSQGSGFALTLNGFTVTLASGYAMAAGRWLENDESITLSLQPSGNSEDRTDAIVVQADYNARKAVLAVLTGVDPTAIQGNPALLRTEESYSLVLYLIRVRRGTTALSPEDVTDFRASPDLCGMVVPLSAIAENTLYVYDFLHSGIDKEVNRLLALSQAVIDKASSAIPELDAAIQKAGGGATIGDLQTVRRVPSERGWLLCDGGAVPKECTALNALLGGILPNLSQPEDRYRTYIYAGVA